MAQARTNPVDRPLNDLAKAIRSIRSDCIPHEIARLLLEYDQPGHTQLIGIDFEGEKVVLYHEQQQYAIAVRFGPDGLAPGGTTIATFQRGSGIERWIEKMNGYWGWIHPRYDS